MSIWGKILDNKLTRLAEKSVLHSAYRRSHDEAALERAMRGRDAISVEFLINSLSAWKTEKLYEAMAAHPRFRPSISIPPSLDEADTVVTAVMGSVGLRPTLAAIQKGKRIALPNSEIMIHQPLGGAQGQATDIKIHAEHIIRTKARLNNILAENTGKPLEEIECDTERDNFMTAEEAMKYGLIDKVFTKRV